ncbi:hypothetical protein PG993_010414 [Apiospora rasikravindrae]|uniref:Uncharacterized protein n=1 Tax=Apiospora rasikravindrae TaxID=990691 RepID=A0ABR1SNW6_9PEZI
MLGSHRDQAHFGFAKWRKRILLPCWFIQIPLQLGLMGVFSYRLSNSVNSYNGEADKIPTVEFVWEVTNIAFSLASFIINAIQIAKFLAEALTPFGMMVGNILSVTLSSAILALDVVVYLQHTEKKYSIIALGMDCVLLFFTIVTVIYGVIVYRRMLIYDDYHIPHNVKPFGFAAPEDTTYDPQRSSTNVSPEPTTEAGNVSGSRSRGASFISVSRSISGEIPQISVTPQPTRPDNERRTSFDHKRNTQYEEYVRKRSGSFQKEDIERALGSSIDWNERRPSETIVSTGLVPSALARPRANSGGRVSSWTLNLGDETLDPEQQRGHSLVSVPESGEEEDITAARKGKQRAFSGDRETLLSQVSPCDRTPSGKSLMTVSSMYSQDDVVPKATEERYEAFRPKRYSAYRPPNRRSDS